MILSLFELLLLLMHVLYRKPIAMHQSSSNVTRVTGPVTGNYVVGINVGQLELYAVSTKTNLWLSSLRRNVLWAMPLRVARQRQAQNFCNQSIQFNL